jgi:hypothetical protein
MIPCRRFHLSEKERPNTLLSQSLHFRRPPDNLAKGHAERIRFYVRGSGHPHAAGWDAGSPPGAGIRSPTDRFWLELSAPIPWLGGAESDEGIEIFGRSEGAHSEAGC